MDQLTRSDKQPAKSLNACNAEFKLGAFNQMSSVDNDSSELHDLVTDVSNIASSNNASNIIVSSSDLEICNSLDFYLSRSDAALNFNSIMGFSDNTVSTASYQWNHHWDMTLLLGMDEMNKMLPFQKKNSFSGNEEGVDVMNKQFSCQNYTDLTASYKSYQYKSHHHDTNINLNLDELNNQFTLQNAEIRQVLESTSGLDEMNKQLSFQNYTDLTASYQSYQYESHHEDTNINWNLDELNNQFALQNTEIRQVLESTSGLCLPIKTDIANENEPPIDVCLEDLPDLLEMDINSVLAGQGNKLITLVLDMDETLVHTERGRCDDANFFIICDDTVRSVKERPHLHYFLEKVSEMFEIVIFTAGRRDYGSQILDKLDPEGRFFSRRFYRDSCTSFQKGDYVKDLTILGVDLAKVAIIDNLPKVFRLQRDNGIPIKSWYHDRSDVELVLMLPFLEILARAEDVRPLISERFNTGRHGISDYFAEILDTTFHS